MERGRRGEGRGGDGGTQKATTNKIELNHAKTCVMVNANATTPTKHKFNGKWQATALLWASTSSHNNITHTKQQQPSY